MKDIGQAIEFMRDALGVVLIPKEEENTMNKIETAILQRIQNASSPLLTYKDFHIKSVPIAPYNELRSTIKKLRENGLIETSNVGYQTTEKARAEHPARTPRAPKVALPVLPCLCGCLAECNPGSFFRPGHDARLKGLVKRANGEGLENTGVLDYAIARGAIKVKGDTYILLTAVELRAL